MAETEFELRSTYSHLLLLFIILGIPNQKTLSFLLLMCTSFQPQPFSILAACPKHVYLDCSIWLTQKVVQGSKFLKEQVRGTKRQGEETLARFLSQRVNRMNKELARWPV
jgi:hypothetical protein